MLLHPEKEMHIIIQKLKLFYRRKMLYESEKQRNCADHLFRILFRTDEYDGAVAGDLPSIEKSFSGILWQCFLR